MSRSTTITIPAFILKASLAVLVLTSFCIAEGRVCIDLFAGDVGKKSEAHRIDVYSRYAQVFAKLERVRKGYQDQLQQITQIQVPQAKPVVIAGVTISAPLTLRPQIAAKTIADLTKAATHTEGRSKREIEILRTIATQSAKADPYFLWLAEQGSDPVPLLLSSIHPDHDQSLPVSLAILQIAYQFDRELLPEHVSAIDKILSTYRLETTLKNRILPMLRTREWTLSSSSAWDLAPSLESARKNLAALLRDATEKYSQDFPQLSFELLKDLEEREAEELDVLYEVMNLTEGKRALSDNESVQYEPRLRRLARQINLPDTTGLKQLWPALTFVGHARIESAIRPNGGSYGHFLTTVFENDRRIVALVDQLQMIIELSEVPDRTDQLTRFIELYSRRPNVNRAL